MAVSIKNPFRLFGGDQEKQSDSNQVTASVVKRVDAPAKLQNEKPICPPRKLTEILIQTARDLQMLPDVAVKAIAIADDPDAKVNDLVNVIAQDVKLTADILSLSNSSVFGSTQPILGLDQALARVGFRQTKNMIFASSITSMMQKMPWQETRIRDTLCKHSFLTGIINSRLNNLFGLGMQGEEFTAGLVHDIGRTLLAVSIPDEFELFDPLNFDESDGLIDRELDCIGTTHAEVGAWFLRRNHLPDELITVARYHHCPQEATMFKRLVAVTAVADDLANFSERHDGDAEFNCAENKNLEILGVLGVEGAVEKLQELATVILESAKIEVNQIL
jgi:HD-like signal output (HDOD) protein